MCQRVRKKNNIETLEDLHGVQEEKVDAAAVRWSVISMYFTPARNNASLSDSVIHLGGVSSLQ